MDLSSAKDNPDSNSFLGLKDDVDLDSYLEDMIGESDATDWFLISGATPAPEIGSYSNFMTNDSIGYQQLSAQRTLEAATPPAFSYQREKPFSVAVSTTNVKPDSQVVKESPKSSVECADVSLAERSQHFASSAVNQNESPFVPGHLVSMHSQKASELGLLMASESQSETISAGVKRKNRSPSLPKKLRTEPTWVSAVENPYQSHSGIPQPSPSRFGLNDKAGPHFSRNDSGTLQSIVNSCSLGSDFSSVCEPKKQETFEAFVREFDPNQAAPPEPSLLSFLAGSYPHLTQLTGVKPLPLENYGLSKSDSSANDPNRKRQWQQPWNNPGLQVDFPAVQQQEFPFLDQQLELLQQGVSDPLTLAILAKIQKMRYHDQLKQAAAAHGLFGNLNFH